MEQFRIKGKLRNKVFVMMALVSVVPIFIAGFLSVYSITLSHKVDVANLEGALIDQKIGEVKTVLANALGVLSSRVITNRPGDLAFTDKPILKNIFETSGQLGLREISLVDLGGKELARINADHPDMVPDADLRDYADAPWFADVKAGKAYFSDDVVFTGGVPTLIIVAPVTDQNGVVRYIHLGNFDLRLVQAAVQNASLGKTGYLYIVERNGKVMGSTVNGPAPEADVSRIGVVKQVLGGQDFSGSAGEQRYGNFYGDTVVAAGKLLPDFHWGFLAEWPAKEADAGVNDLIYKNAIILGIVLLAVIALSIMFSALIVRPIRILEKGTELAAQGKFDAEVRIGTGDELEELGSAFNKMMAGLKQLQELKDEFVFIAAHELRTPVAAMKGYLTLILQGLTGPITDKTKDFIEKVVDSNQRLIQLVNDLLEVSRSEGGKLTIKVSAIDIAAPIKAVLVELASLATEKQVQMVYEPQADLPKAMADSDRLKEVIVNLVGNSIKYMGGSGKVTISNAVQGSDVITRIQDTGIGMSKEAQAKLFEKFYRVASEKTKDIQGTGLGLFIVKEIIEKMNGRIWVTSEEGKGSTFSFSLPLA